MGARNVLSRRSDVQHGAIPTSAAAAGRGFATFLGCGVAGLIPLLAYLLPLSGESGSRRQPRWHS